VNNPGCQPAERLPTAPLITNGVLLCKRSTILTHGSEPIHATNNSRRQFAEGRSAIFLRITRAR
jgi:hypothetical protein